MCNKVNEFCGSHLVSGSPAKYWDKHNIDWIPTLNLGNMQYKGEFEGDARKGESASKECHRTGGTRSCAKCKCVNESGTRISSLDFSENTEDACDQYADAGKVEMKLDDAYASSAFANEALDSHFSSC